MIAMIFGMYVLFAELLSTKLLLTIFVVYRRSATGAEATWVDILLDIAKANKAGTIYRCVDSGLRFALALSLMLADFLVLPWGENL